MELTHREFAHRFAALSADLGSGELDVLIGLLHRREVAEGEVLIAEGKTSDVLFLVWEGAAGVRLGGAEVGRYGTGATLGEISFLDGGPSTASVVTVLPTTLLWIDRATFESLYLAHPRIATCLLHAVCRELATRMRNSTELLESLREGRDGGEPQPGPPHHGFLDAIRHLFGLAPAQPDTVSDSTDIPPRN